MMIRPIVFCSESVPNLAAEPCTNASCVRRMTATEAQHIGTETFVYKSFLIEGCKEVTLVLKTNNLA